MAEWKKDFEPANAISVGLSGLLSSSGDGFIAAVVKIRILSQFYTLKEEEEKLQK